MFSAYQHFFHNVDKSVHMVAGLGSFSKPLGRKSTEFMKKWGFD